MGCLAFLNTVRPPGNAEAARDDTISDLFLLIQELNTMVAWRVAWCGGGVVWGRRSVVAAWCFHVGNRPL